MESFKTQNTVIGIHFSDELDLNNISELLLCLYIENSDKSYSKNTTLSKKIPFYGINNSIISIRYNMKSRGLRIGGRQLRNTVAIDLQYSNKNLHNKLSKNKILITGCLNETMGIESFYILLEHIKNCNNFLKFFSELNNEKKINSIKWIKKIMYNTDNLIYMYDDIKVLQQFNNIPKDIDYNFCKYLSMFSYDCITYEHFEKKIDIILNIPKNENNNYCYSSFPKITSYTIYNSLYSYNILDNSNLKISLIKLANFLIANNYNTSYHNWHKKCINVLILITDNTKSDSQNTDVELDDYEIYKNFSDSEDETDNIDEDVYSDSDDENLNIKYKKEKIKGHRFQIYHNGSIRQNSPIYKSQAYEEMYKFTTFLKNNISEFTYN